jgi:uncharacterized protein (TIGR00255 family)
MAASSMTGFARVDGAYGAARWTWEMKSVNGRGLEPRFRLPPGFEFLEPELRRMLAERFSRGSFGISLFLKEGAGGSGFRVNQAALEAALKAVEEIRLRIECERPRPEGVLALKGVIEQDQGVGDDAARESVASAMLESFADALSALAAAREGEGAALAKLIESLFVEIESLTAAARAAAELTPALIRDRVAAQLAELLSQSVPADRILEEAAMLAARADIREELDRLAAHVAAGRALLADPGPSGRRLDFLTQELNREANTLCSKAQDLGLKRIGLDLKTAIDRMREQVQNVA